MRGAFATPPASCCATSCARRWWQRERLTAAPLIVEEIAISIVASTDARSRASCSSSSFACLVRA